MIRKFKMTILLVMLLLPLGASVDAQTNRSMRQPEGFTEPFKTVIVASPESGVLQSLPVREGDTIKQSDVIATLDSQVLAVSVLAAKDKLNAQGKVRGATANRDSKAHHLQQIETLFQKQHASDLEVQQAQLEYDLAVANLETTTEEKSALQMELKRIEAQLERRRVRAPISGTILELPRQVGEAITASESHVATIVALDQLRVRYFLATQRAAGLQRGQTVSVSFPDTQQNADATVDFVSPVTDSKSGTVRVELLIDNSTRNYRSGLRCLLGNTQTARKPNRNSNRNVRD